jgi:hypothetical protein
MGALLELRHDLDHALLHRFLDVLPPPHRPLERQPHAEHVRDRGLVLAHELTRLVEVAARDRRLDPAPGALIARPHFRERRPALDGDRGRDRPRQQDREHERPARGEEPDNWIEEVHMRTSANVAICQTISGPGHFVPALNS